MRKGGVRCYLTANAPFVFGVYRVDETVKASGLGRTFLYERIASGELKSIKVGRRRLILKNDLLSFLDRRCGTSEI